MISLSFTVKPDGQAQIVPNQSVKASYATVPNLPEAIVIKQQAVGSVQPFDFPFLPSEIIYTQGIKAFTIFSSICDLKGHNSVMFDEITQHMSQVLLTNPGNETYVHLIVKQ